MMKKRRRPARRKYEPAKRTQPSARHAVNADLVAALNHPTRKELLTLFLERDAAISPKELAALTEQKLPTISYHVRVLADKSAIELTEEEQVRGSVAHFYEASDLTKSTSWVLESLGVDAPRA